MGIKVAVVGAGRWGKNLVRTFSELDVLSVVVERSPELRNSVLEQYPGIHACENLSEILSSDIQAIAVATPVFTHFEVAKQALNAGKDVFVEKPLAVTFDEADELRQLAKEKGAVLMVGHMLLYQPAIQFIKKFIDEGQLGKLLSLRQVRRNLGTIRTQENSMYSLGVHDLAVLSYLVGESAASVKAVGQVVITEGVEDDMSVHFQYPSGAQAHLHVTWLWPYKERNLMILGEKGALLFDELKQEVTFFKTHANGDATITNDGKEVLFKNSGQALTFELEHFVDCVKSRNEPNSSADQGVEVVSLLEEISKQVKGNLDGSRSQ